MRTYADMPSRIKTRFLRALEVCGVEPSSPTVIADTDGVKVSLEDGGRHVDLEWSQRHARWRIRSYKTRLPREG